MKRNIQIWGSRFLVLAAVMFAAQYWGKPLYKQYFTPKKNTVFVPTAEVKTGKFVVSFHEIGTLEAVKSVPINTMTGGKIIKLIKEGVFVKPGDEIVELDTTDLQRDVRNQALTLKNANADVDRAKEELRMLKLSNQTDLDKQTAEYEYNKNELALAEKQRDKKKHLADEKLIPRDQVDQAEMEVRSKQLAVTKGEKDLELKKKDIASKENQKKADVDKVIFAANIAKSNLDEVQDRVKQATITAPAAGMVVLTKDWMGDSVRKIQEGDTVRPRQIICQLPDLTSMQVSVKVGESDAPKVKAGLPVLIRLEAVPKKVFHGTVKEVSSLATEGDMWDPNTTPGRKDFEVTISVKEVDPKVLKPGMTADVEFICDSVGKALSVPLESVIEKDGKTFVYVKDGKRWVRTPVVTGKFNDNFIIITKGLHVGQKVALRDPTRPMDEQEPVSSSVGSDEDKDKKGSAPIPGAADK